MLDLTLRIVIVVRGLIGEGGERQNFRNPYWGRGIIEGGDGKIIKNGRNLVESFMNLKELG